MTQPRSGGNGTVAHGLEMGREADRATVRRAVAEGWDLGKVNLGEFTKALQTALRIAVKNGSSREIRGVVATMKSLVDQIQRQEERDEKNERLDVLMARDEGDDVEVKRTYTVAFEDRR